jgi:hypothetical protein
LASTSWDGPSTSSDAHLGSEHPGTAANSRSSSESIGYYIPQPSAGLKAEASRASMGGSVYRSRTLRAAQLAAQPTARYRPGRIMRPAVASSRAAGCRAALRAKSLAFAGFLRSRTRAARSLMARRATFRRVADRADVMISLRVSANVAMRTTRANLVTDGIRLIQPPLCAAQPSAKRVAESTQSTMKAILDLSQVFVAPFRSCSGSLRRPPLSAAQVFRTLHTIRSDGGCLCRAPIPATRSDRSSCMT